MAAERRGEPVAELLARLDEAPKEDLEDEYALVGDDEAEADLALWRIIEDKLSLAKAIEELCVFEGARRAGIIAVSDSQLHKYRMNPRLIFLDARARTLLSRYGSWSSVPEEALVRRRRGHPGDLPGWAILWDRVERNPMDRIPRAPQPPGRYVEVFTDSEVAELTSLDDLRDRALMAVLFDAGLRKAEARHLRAGRCLLEERQLVVVGGKGGKDRVIPMGERLASVLADLFLTEGIEPEQFLWYGRRGNQLGYRAIMRSKPIGEGTFHRWWTRCLDAAGVRYRNPHTARHTFATHWLKRGGRMETLSKAMGHASIATTVDLYGHLDLSDVARDLALVESSGEINPLQKEAL